VKFCSANFADAGMHESAAERDMSSYSSESIDSMGWSAVIQGLNMLKGRDE
jgi:hypothetical protein